MPRLGRIWSWKALHRHWPALDLDYINAGVPGYTTQSSLRRLELQVAQFKPDMIVIYHATNDLGADAYRQAQAQGVAPHRQEENMGWLSRHSLLVYLIGKNLEVMRLQREATNTSGKIRLDIVSLDAEFRQNYANLVVASQKVAKLVVTVTFSARLRPGETPEERREAAATSLYYMPYMSIADLLTGYAQYNQVIREVAKSYGTVLVGDEDAIPPDARHFVQLGALYRCRQRRHGAPGRPGADRISNRAVPCREDYRDSARRLPAIRLGRVVN